ncbi:hypothetical protein A3H10_02910 [Candidatus Uhrbacteria bacterium RIFCSPLOWO2_12_FULL_46_10]|uniref:Uncharacterized protein n=1 Tax=Candidatus Uhrbacteria bacterium RIFCSPLOWO2_01_FULL_47_25 TaxID=1802402 RepID=A0A1F7UW60_9BACT|nr:MAG: hypothetical protein A2936_03760 [Candidatus Uhrbacteria bacterium RIFCSPLOWO2_01_FULL_47_25]OGL91497.1 MAG: hypothetical protein A3H10_02910 [Candidatus Uhrbacteria bacterium RIFCSPLOWO2_12_FULL_46_10]
MIYMTESKELNEPHIFNTHDARLRAHFEKYDGETSFENGEPEFDEVRLEIAAHYGVPLPEESDGPDEKTKGHIFIVDNKLVENQRHHRAFCVVRRREGEKQDAWYIDGRLAHVALLGRLYNYYKVPNDEHNEVCLGFLDNEGFSDIEEIQKKARVQNSPITWFIRETVTPS